ncbi:MAG TPA: sulfite exporter TauE/SafE family protein [Thermoplasmatales archaeon]|nr:sulfite exporter TauE/SafE family protein [Thermoplasmatales archaeon]
MLSTPPVVDESLSQFLILLVGCSSGLSVGIASGTAESFIVPFLTIYLAASVYQAIGTSLLIDGIIGGTAGVIFLLKGNVKFKSVILVVITGIIGAAIGGIFTTGTPEIGLKIAIAVVLITLGVTLLRGGVKRNVEYVNSKISFNWFKKRKVFSSTIFGLIVGFASGFSGMGSSGIVTFFLIFIMEYDLHTSIGTSLLMMLFIAGSGALSHGLQGEVIWSIALIAGVGAAIGGILGSLFANKIDEEKLGRLIGGIIVILGLLVTFNIAGFSL